MAPITIPEGHVFVARGQGVAAALLDSVDAVEGDRQADVRTVSGGYHVRQEVAEHYQSTLPAKDDAEAETEEEGNELAAPDKTWKVADIDEWAQEHLGLDTSSEPNKEARLKAIADALSARD